MKRNNILSLLLAALLAFSLTACGTKADAPAESLSLIHI